MYFAHPFMIIRFLKPFWFIAVFPLIKGLIQYILYRDVSGVLTLESVALGIVFFIAVLRWRSISIRIEDDYLTVKQGFLFKKTAKIDIKRLSSVTMSENPADILFRAVNCKINTEAGRASNTDFNIKLYRNDARELYAFLYGDEGRTALRSPTFKIALMSATTSSAFSGLIIGVPTANRAADLLGIALSELFIDKIKLKSNSFTTVFPTTVQIITLILVAAYLFSALVSFFRNLFFRVKMGGDKLEICSGFFVKRKTVFRKSCVNNVIIEQTPLMRLCRRFSMGVNVAGYGNIKGERAIVAPFGKHSEIRDKFLLFFPFLACDGHIISAQHGYGSMMRFFFVPTLLFALLMAFTVPAIYFFPYFDRLIIFISMVLAALICYYSNLCLYNYRFGRIRFGSNISARSSSGFNIRELYCERERVGEIKLIRYPADRINGTCKVKLTVRSENADSIRVRNVDYLRVRNEIYNCFNDNTNK